MHQQDFLELIIPFKDKVFRLAKRLLVSTEEAEDATQELFLKLWKNKEKIKSYKNIEAFAMTVTKNYCLDQLKSKRASNLKLVHGNYKEKGISLEKKIEIQDSIEIVNKIIDSLSDNQKIIIQLRDVEQYEFNEIAKILDMTTTAVRVSLSRARKNIKEQLIKKHNYGIR